MFVESEQIGKREKNRFSAFTFGITFLTVVGLSFVDTSFKEIGSCFPSSNSVGYLVFMLI